MKDNGVESREIPVGPGSTPALAASETGVRDARGHFLKGNRIGAAGRPKGLKDRRSERKEGLFQLYEFGAYFSEKLAKRFGFDRDFPPRFVRLVKIYQGAMKAGDFATALRAELEIFEHDFGKPRQTVDLFVQSDVVKHAREKLSQAHSRRRPQLMHAPIDIEAKAS